MITNDNISLTVFRMNNLGYWQNRIVAAMQAAGCGALRKGMSCTLWSPNSVQAVSNSTLRYADGVKVVRQDLGRGQGALAIIPRRVYFEGTSDSPSSRPEWDLLGDRRIALPSPSSRIASCLSWAEAIAEHIEGFDPRPVAVTRVRTDLHKSTSMVFADGARAAAGLKISSLLMMRGFYAAPENFRIVMVTPPGQDERAKFYQKELAKALARCHAHGVLAKRSYDEFIRTLEAGELVSAPGTVILLGVTGKKRLPLSPEARKIVAMLSTANIPFRMFSVDNPALNWSALDQVGSLVAGAGGIPYVVNLPWPEGLEKPFLLGVDLGHPMASRISRVVISLLDHRGIHLESWRHVQNRDETIGEQTLITGLQWARDAAQRHGGGGNPGFLVLRDGRLHKGEKAATYRRLLGNRMTLVEFSKYDNPEMFIAGEKSEPAKAGTECLLEGSDAPFITPIAPRLSSDLARTFKLNMKPEWDGLGLGMDKVSEIITGLSYTPGLGLAQHALPGPIYWADGIAAIGEMNHQFAGQRVAEKRNSL